MHESPLGPIAPLTLADLDAFTPSTNGHTNGAAATFDAYERDQVPDGERDNALAALAGWLRTHSLWRFSEVGLRTALFGVVAAGALEQPPRREISQADVDRVARSIARHPAGEPSFEVTVPDESFALLAGGETSIIGPPVKWWVHQFLPHDELVMVYGPKAAGKSTFASWLSTLVTRSGEVFLHIGVEEPFTRFLARAKLGGADASKIFSVADASAVRLPTSIEILKETVRRTGAKVVYFDSIYSHFDGGDKALESTRARRCLGPLAQMAQELGVTVVAVFHDRRSDGDYMGSTEMINVARVILRLSRRQGQSSRLTVRTTNFTHPECSLRLDAVDMRVEDGGEVQMEMQEDGTLLAMQLKVIQAVERVGEETEAAALTLDDIAPDTHSNMLIS